MKAPRTTLALLTSVILSAAGIARSYDLVHVFEPTTVGPYNNFGTAVGLEGNVAVVKSNSGYLDSDGFTATHVFEQEPTGAWQTAATLDYDSGDNDGNPFLGQEIALDGGVIAIGFADEFDNPSTTSLQFATRGASGWSVGFSEPSTHTPPVFANLSPRATGRSVDVSGGWAIADDAFAVRADGSGTGVARVYHRGEDTLWREAANLFPAADGLLNVNSVAIDGNTAALIDRGPTMTDDPAGVYFFQRQEDDSWDSNDFISESEFVPSSFSLFNAIVELHGDIATVFDPIGKIAILERAGGDWQLSSPLDLSIAPLAVAIEGDLMALSTGGLNGALNRVEILRRVANGDWQPFATIDDPRPELGLNFGASLDFDHQRLLVGAAPPAELVDGSNGAAYLFAPVPEPACIYLLAVALTAAYGFRRIAASPTR